MKIGFTGTRYGMTQEQKEMVYDLVNYLKPKEVHEGGCIGADNDFVNICLLSVIEPRIVNHPGKSYYLGTQHDQHNNFCDERRAVKTYLNRNRDIVLEVDLMIATPKTYTQTGGGTWYTITYAKRFRRPCYVVLPNGDILVRT